MATEPPFTKRKLGSEASLVLVSTFVWLAAWTFVKPPYHAPDEAAHHLRAMALPGTPWVATSDSLAVRGTEWNPLAWRSHALMRLVHQPAEHLTSAEVDGLETSPWLEPGEIRTTLTQAWTYPPVYYWMVSAIAEPLGDSLRATPWQSVFLYRLVTSAWAAALWALVFAAMSSVPELRATRWSVLVFVVANPMLAFISSSINTDSVHIPLSALWLLVSYRFLADERWGLTLPWLTLWVALTKPAAWPTFMAVGVAVAIFVAMRQWSLRRALAWAALTGAGAVAAVLVFYVDSPVRLYGHPSGLSTLGYLHVLVLSTPNRWTQLWGRLGWLDYQLPQVFYWLWLALLAAIAWRDRRPIVSELARWRFPAFAAASLVLLFFILHLHEWWGLRARGLYLQGRYLFPLWLGTSVLIVAVRPWHRRGLVATVVAFALALLVVSVDRYYGSWDVFEQAWPWN
jgi:hypothetical protein